LYEKESAIAMVILCAVSELTQTGFSCSYEKIFIPVMLCERREGVVRYFYS
jgi:hypothetical protein